MRVTSTTTNYLVRGFHLDLNVPTGEVPSELEAEVLALDGVVQIHDATTASTTTVSPEPTVSTDPEPVKE